MLAINYELRRRREASFFPSIITKRKDIFERVDETFSLVSLFLSRSFKREIERRNRFSFDKKRRASSTNGKKASTIVDANEGERERERERKGEK